LFDGAAGWIGSATDYASGAAGTAATGGDIEDVPDFEAPEPEDDLASAEFGEGMYASSDDGDVSDYGAGASAGSIFAPPGTPEMSDPIVIGDVVASPMQIANARELGFKRGYDDGYKGRPYVSSASDVSVILGAPYEQGYSEGYPEGVTDKKSGAAPAYAGKTVSTGGGGGKPIATTDTEVAPGMSTGMKIGLALLGAAGAAGVVVMVSRKRRRKAA
jgi:hypothetical protein